MFKGNTGNLGHDLNPGNLFNDAGKDFSKQPIWAKGAEIAIPAILATIFSGGTDLPALLPALGDAGGLAADTGAAVDLGASLAGDAGIAGQVLGDAGTVAADASLPADALALAAPEASLTSPALTGIDSALASAPGAGGAGGIAGQTVASTEMLPAVSQGADAASGPLSWMANNKGLLALLGTGVAGQVLSPQISKMLGLNKVPGAQPLTNLANQEAGVAGQQQQQGANLESYLTSGGLPAGQQQQVTNATNDAINTIKSRYAGMGLSGSTAEADAISYAQNNAGAIAGQLQAQDYQLGQQAVSEAVSAMGLQQTIYSELLNAQIAQDQQLGGAIANLMKAFGTGAGQQAAKQALAA